MAWSKLIRTTFRSWSIPTAPLEGQSRVSRSSYYTASEGGEQVDSSNYGEEIWNGVPPEALDTMEAQALAHVISHSATVFTATDDDSAAINLNTSKQTPDKPSKQAVTSPNEYDDSVFDGLTEDDFRNLENQAIGIRQLQGNPVPTTVPKIANESKRTAVPRTPAQTAGRSGTASTPFDLKEIGQALPAIPQLESPRPTPPNVEYDDSVFDGLTEDDFRNLENQAIGIRRLQGNPVQTTAPKIANEPKQRAVLRTPAQIEGRSGTATTAFDLKEIGQALPAKPSSSIAPRTDTPQRQSGGSPFVIKRLKNPAQPADPSLSSVEAPGTYGYRYDERKRLASYGHDVFGGSYDTQGEYRSRFESDHIYSFATAYPHPMRRTSKEGKEAADKGMAYYEFGDLHRNHISSQNTYDVLSGKVKIEGADHGWEDPGTFRNHLRSALRYPETVATGENLSIAAQLHMLDYGFMHQRAYQRGSPHGAYPDYKTLSAARNSFGFMLKSSPAVHIADNTGSGNPPDETRMSAKTRAELILAHQATVGSEYPTSGDARRVAKAVLPKKEYDEKQTMWDACDKAAGRPRQDDGPLYDERAKTRGRGRGR